MCRFYKTQLSILLQAFCIYASKKASGPPCASVKWKYWLLNGMKISLVLRWRDPVKYYVTSSENWKFRYQHLHRNSYKKSTFWNVTS